MGNRAEVIIHSNGGQVCLYTHWLGEKLPQIVQTAMRRGIDRLKDPPYLARIIFCEMVRGDLFGCDGFGISQQTAVDLDREIFLFMDQQAIKVGDCPEVYFEAFMAAANITWDGVL